MTPTERKGWQPADTNPFYEKAVKFNVIHLAPHNAVVTTPDETASGVLYMVSNGDVYCYYNGTNTKLSGGGSATPIDETNLVHKSGTETITGNKNFTGVVTGEDVDVSRIGLLDLANGYYNYLHYEDEDFVYEKGDGHKVYLTFPNSNFLTNHYQYPFSGSKNVFRLVSSVNNVEPDDAGNVNLNLNYATTEYVDNAVAGIQTPSLQNAFDVSKEAGNDPTIVYGEDEQFSIAGRGKGITDAQSQLRIDDEGITLTKINTDQTISGFSLNPDGVGFFAANNKFTIQGIDYAFPTSRPSLGQVLAKTGVNGEIDILGWQNPSMGANQKFGDGDDTLTTDREVDANGHDFTYHISENKRLIHRWESAAGELYQAQFGTSSGTFTSNRYNAAGTQSTGIYQDVNEVRLQAAAGVVQAKLHVDANGITAEGPLNLSSRLTLTNGVAAQNNYHGLLDLNVDNTKKQLIVLARTNVAPNNINYVIGLDNSALVVGPGKANESDFTKDNGYYYFDPASGAYELGSNGSVGIGQISVTPSPASGHAMFWMDANDGGKIKCTKNVSGTVSTQTIF